MSMQNIFFFSTRTYRWWWRSKPSEKTAYIGFSRHIISLDQISLDSIYEIPMDKRMKQSGRELMRNQHCYTNNFGQKTTKTNKEIKIQPHNLKLACEKKSLVWKEKKSWNKDTNLMNWAFACYCCCRFYAIFILKLKVC